MSDRPLTERFDVAMLDLDGVVYIGGRAVPGAAQAIASARSAGMRFAFITNNASRPAVTVADHLSDLGVDALPDDVVTSAQAAARVLADRWGPDSCVIVLGGEGLWTAVGDRGLRGVGIDADEASSAVAIVTGYGPDVLWRDIMRAAVLIKDGLPWVATNTDGSIPTPYGVAPGHGVLVETLARFSGVEPTIAGKPAPPLLQETIARTGAQSALMVGDRLDTDIAAGSAVGVPTLLVLTGVTGLTELISARAGERPSYLSSDLGGLLTAHPAVTTEGDTARCGGWTARAVDGALEVSGAGAVDDWWRAVATAAWAHLDESDALVDVTDLVPPTWDADGSLEP